MSVIDCEGCRRFIHADDVHNYGGIWLCNDCAPIPCAACTAKGLAVDQLDAYIRDCIEDRKRQNNYDAQLALQCVRRKMAKLGMIEI